MGGGEDKSSTGQKFHFFHSSNLCPSTFNTTPYTIVLKYGAYTHLFGSHLVLKVSGIVKLHFTASLFVTTTTTTQHNHKTVVGLDTIGGGLVPNSRNHVLIFHLFVHWKLYFMQQKSDLVFLVLNKTWSSVSNSSLKKFGGGSCYCSRCYLQK